MPSDEPPARGRVGRGSERGAAELARGFCTDGSAAFARANGRAWCRPSYDDAAKSLGRITDALINHGPASLGPIITIAPATDAIANVIALTVVANLLDRCAFDDDEDPAIDLG